MRWVLSLLLALSAVSIAPFAIASGPDCDRLASIAADPDHQATPVDYGGIDGARVIEVCGQAVSEFPDNGRYWVQLGRGYLKLDRGQAMPAWAGLSNLHLPNAIGLTLTVRCSFVTSHLIFPFLI